MDFVQSPWFSNTCSILFFLLIPQFSAFFLLLRKLWSSPKILPVYKKTKRNIRKKRTRRYFSFILLIFIFSYSPFSYISFSEENLLRLFISRYCHFLFVLLLRLLLLNFYFVIISFSYINVIFFVYLIVRV